MQAYSKQYNACRLHNDKLPHEQRLLSQVGVVVALDFSGFLPFLSDITVYTLGVIMFRTNSDATSKNPIFVGDESPTLRRSIHEKAVYFKPVATAVEDQPTKSKAPLRAKESKGKFSTREKLLLLAVVVLFILALIFLVLYATKSGRAEEEENARVCLSSSCVAVTAGWLNLGYYQQNGTELLGHNNVCFTFCISYLVMPSIIKEEVCVEK